jgi:hypothetical protein
LKRDFSRKLRETDDPKKKGRKTSMPSNLEGVRVAILAVDGVEEAELVEPRKALDEAGARTTLISLKREKTNR